MKKLRKDKKEMKKRIDAADLPEEKEGLSQLSAEITENIKAIRRAENSRKKRWKRKKQRTLFFKNPYAAGKEVLLPRVRKELSISTADLDVQLKSITADIDRDVPLKDLEGLGESVDVEIPFDSSQLKENDLDFIIKRTRNASAPGPNKIPYKVYKKCKELKKHLFKLMKSCINSKKIPVKWRIAEGVYIPKVQEPREKKYEDFRPISLLNVEGKLFWSMVSNRLYSHLVTKNKMINISCQKGSIKEMSGCLEHITMVWSALQDARRNRRSLVNLWLDLANAYGSVPHALIFFALRRYGIPEDWIRLIQSYYDGLWGRFQIASGISSWHRFEKGIFQGCTLSVVLFLAAFNVILEFVKSNDIRGYKKDNLEFPILRTFMDDLSIMTSNVKGALKALERTTTAL